MKGIFSNKKLRIVCSMAVLLVSMVSFFIVQSCSNECESMESIESSTVNPLEKVKITDFKNWLESQEIVTELIVKQELNWSNTELKILPDGNSLLVSFEIYKGKNSLGNDSIRELQIAYVKNSFTGGIKVYSFNNKEYADAKYYSQY